MPDATKVGTLLIDTKVDPEGFDKGVQQMDKSTNNLLDLTKVKWSLISAVVVKAFDTMISAFGRYEQLIGGVDTLFKASSEKVQQYANEAYMTAGVSANRYMEQVTSFSASLLQSLDGDTEKATEYANQAIIDMADNANKMGTDIQSIQNAYQGFAKQNYMMLDNLNTMGALAV